MKRILSANFLILTLLCSCNADPDISTDQEANEPTCPYEHTDSIIPIIYGYPSETDFEKSDSGLIALGGCALPDNPDKWFCKIHKVSF